VPTVLSRNAGGFPGVLRSVDRREMLSGKVKIEINHTFALRDAQQVHRDLESRKTTGSIVMVP
jgi:hypothetical protein